MTAQPLHSVLSAGAQLRLHSILHRSARSFAFVLGLVAAAGCSCPSWVVCNNELVSRETSPSGRQSAVVYLRECGATTAYSVHISVLRDFVNLPNESGNVFVAEMEPGSGYAEASKVKAKWLDKNRLLVEHPPRMRVFIREASADGVSIEYAALQ